MKKQAVVVLSVMIGIWVTMIASLVGDPRQHHCLVPTLSLLVWCGLMYVMHDTVNVRLPYWTCIVSLSALGGAAGTVVTIVLAAVPSDPHPSEPLAFAGMFACIVAGSLLAVAKIKPAAPTA